MDPIKDEEVDDADFDLQSDEDSESVQSESLPEASIYDKGLRNSVENMKKRLGEIVTLMESHNLDADAYSGLKNLQQEAERLRDFQIKENRTVGFIGDSGVGKSSLINSLLDLENFARSGGDGAACTSVVTEFRYVDDTHKHPWTTEVYFMNTDEIKELLEELLRSFRMFYCDSGNSEGAQSPEDRLDFQEGATRAWTTIQSILPGNNELTEGFLAGDHEGAWEQIMAKMQKCANESIACRQNDPQDLVMTLVADDLEGCKHHLNRIMAKSGDRENPPLWPFINIVRVFIDRPLLRTGLILADLPGFRDLNYARVRATERYMLHHCDEVFVVCGIARCCTDQSIVDIKRRCEGKPQHIICTRSEAISHKEEADGDSDYAKTVFAMNGRADKLVKMMERTRKNRRKAEGPSKKKYGERLAELTDQLEEKLLERKELLMNTRNARVKKELKGLYEDSEVFCVSNKLYTKYRNNHSNQAQTYIELSGIGELRERCYLVPAENQLREIKAFLTHQVSAHLGSLRQWVIVGAEIIAAENAAVLRKALDDVLAILHEKLLSPNSIINCLVDDLTQIFRSHVLAIAEKNETSWTGKCLEASQLWTDYHHMTYAAFCRRNGSFKSKSMAVHQCWNDDLTRCMRRSLKKGWGEVHKWLRSQHEKINTSIPEIFKESYDLLRQREHDAPHAIRNLLCSMEARKRNITHEIESFVQLVHQTTETTAKDMCYGHDSSFMGTVMRPAYLASSEERGRGSHMRRKNIIFEHIQNASILSAHRIAANNEYPPALANHFDTFSTALHKEFGGISDDLKVLASQAGGAPQLDETGLIRQLQSKVDNAQAALEAAQKVLQQLEEDRED